MDTYELAKKWLSENERRFHCAQMDSDEIALSAFIAGFEAAQQSVQPTNGGLCAVCGKPASHHEDHDYVAPLTTISG